MRKDRILWLIVGIVLIFAGVLLLGISATVGLVLFLAGIAVLVILSVSWMRVSGGMKANYFCSDGSASQKMDSGAVPTEVPADIWDQLTEKRGETE